ncbi:MAG: response regulator [Candidatus Omnitrophota bacterium]
MTKKILVIDDEELVTKTLLKLLSREGYSVTVTRSGKEAIEKVKESDFDLIISDVMMPELDGIETIKLIRNYLENSNKAPIPEVIITGYADMEKYESAKELEVMDYLYKPFDSAEFLRIIKKTIG